jgi:inosine-uridine nucleoside N-ribohydrolase
MFANMAFPGGAYSPAETTVRSLTMYRFTVTDEKKIRVILDTDAACEADDPFAVAHELLSPKLIVKAIVAEHFALSGSMEKCYTAIHTLVSKMNLQPTVLRGETEPLGSGEPLSEGVEAIIAEARSEDPRPLMLLCQGALTNAARALAAAPDIIGRMTIVTIGGQAYDGQPLTMREFNFGNDVAAANAVLASGAAVIQVPLDVYSMMRVGLAELEAKVAPCGEVGKYLFEQMVAYNDSPTGWWTQGESWSLGDSPAVGIALHPECGVRYQRKALRVNQDTSYSTQELGTTITVYQNVDSRYILEDFFAKLALFTADERR